MDDAAGAFTPPGREVRWRMLPAILAHAVHTEHGLAGWYPVVASVALALGIGALVPRLFRGPLGESHPRRLATLAVLVAAASGLLVGVGRLVLPT